MRYQILITRSSPNFFGISVTLEGYCLGVTSYYTSIADPNSYTLMTQISIITVTFHLSSDSSTITMSNSIDSTCDAVAVRQAAIVETTTVQTTTIPSTTIPTTTVPSTTVPSTTIPTTTIPTTTVPTTTVQTTTVQTTTVQTTTIQTTTVHSNAVPQYVNIIMLCSLVLFLL
jgi:hypothetical protein